MQRHVTFPNGDRDDPRADPANPRKLNPDSDTPCLSPVQLGPHYRMTFRAPSH